MKNRKTLIMFNSERIKLLQTLLPYRLPKQKDSETSFAHLPDKVDIKIIGRNDEEIIDI
tara:strand:- start:120 stop:296 length:177 start_codon:yes stop_codon:yes gene_type:complete